jgi:hypothetical protein
MRSEPFISDWVAGSGGGQQAARGTAARGGARWQAAVPRRKVRRRTPKQRYRARNEMGNTPK